jgi:hypothetical protein
MPARLPLLAFLSVIAATGPARPPVAAAGEPLRVQESCGARFPAGKGPAAERSVLLAGGPLGAGGLRTQLRGGSQPGVAAVEKAPLRVPDGRRAASLLSSGAAAGDLAKIAASLRDGADVL